MVGRIKKFLYNSLGVENYVRLMQRTFFVLFNSGALRPFREFAYHYNIKKIINKGDVIIDIGANLGYYSIPFAKRTGPQGHVYSVEPIALYNKIFNEKARRFKNITLMPYALGEEEGPVEMVLPLVGGYLHTGLSHVGRTDHERQTDELRFGAQMRNPGRLFADLAKLDYVKCDVEGFELHALGAMREVIARLRPTVQAEVWPENLEGMLELFGGMYYRAYRLERGRLVPLMQTTTDGDIIFVPAEKTIL